MTETVYAPSIVANTAKSSTIVSQWPYNGNIVVPNTSQTWTDVVVSGTSTNNLDKPLDVVIPDVSPGQMIEVWASLYSLSTTGAVYLDAWSVVNGVAINRFGGSLPLNTGTPSTTWLFSASVTALNPAAIPKPYLVKAEDIEDGCIRCRLRGYHSSGAQRTILGTFGATPTLFGRGPFDLRGTNVVFDGQSMNHIPQSGPYPAAVMDGLGVPWTISGVSGASWTTLASTVELRTHQYFKPYRNSILVLAGGSSDVSDSGDNDTGAQALADMEAYADAARAAGANYIIACTVTPANIMTGDGEAQRLILNTGILASNHWEAVVDVAAHPDLDNYSDTTYYSDGAHLTAAGVTVYAGLVRPAVQAALALL